jgi:hypothetical protein
MARAGMGGDPGPDDSNPVDQYRRAFSDATKVLRFDSETDLESQI